MSASSYRQPPTQRRRRRPKTDVQRNATTRARTRHLHQLMRLAGAMQHGPVSMVVLTSCDNLTRGEWQRIFQQWSKLAAHAGIITWTIGVYHERGPNGRIVRPHVHVLCDLHDDARRLLRLHVAHKTPRYRRWNAVKLDQHGLTLAKLAHRVGIGHKTHWRIIDDGGPGYLHGRQWTGRDDWIYNTETVSTFIPSTGSTRSPEYAAILDAMRHTDTDEQAVKVARHLMTNTNTPPGHPQPRTQPRPLPPSAAAARQRRLLAPGGLLTTWLRDHCDTTIPGSFYGQDRPVMLRSGALTSFDTYCDEQNARRPPRRDFIQAMDTIFTTHQGYWDRVTLRAHPTQADDVWDYDERQPPDPNAIPPILPTMPGTTATPPQASPTPVAPMPAPPPPEMSPERTRQQRLALEATPLGTRRLMA